MTRAAAEKLARLQTEMFAAGTDHDAAEPTQLPLAVGDVQAAEDEAARRGPGKWVREVMAPAEEAARQIRASKRAQRAASKYLYASGDYTLPRNNRGY